MTTTCRSCIGTRPSRWLPSMPKRALDFAHAAGKTIPVLREFMLRRIGSLDKNAGLAVLVGGIGRSKSPEEQLNIVRGLRTALSGQRRVKPPAEWSTVYRKLVKSNNPDLKAEANAVGVVFGDAEAMDSLRTLVQLAACRCRSASRRAQSTAGGKRSEVGYHAASTPQRSETARCGPGRSRHV